MTGPHNTEIPKLRTEIEGFDPIAYGGLPEGRATLLSGTSGSARTVIAAQFLAAGIAKLGQPGVFVTFEESPEDIRRNMAGFGWDIPAWEEQGKLAFVDASPEPGDSQMFIAGNYDLGALLARIEHAIRKVGARRVALDSLGGVFAQLDGEPFREVSGILSGQFRRILDPDVPGAGSDGPTGASPRG